MNKLLSMLTILICVITTTASAKQVDIYYDGMPTSKTVSLATGDIVMLHTSIPVNTLMFVNVAPTHNVDDYYGHYFDSSVIGVMPFRSAEFYDYIYTGSNPGWISYTYVADKDAEFNFNIYS